MRTPREPTIKNLPLLTGADNYAQWKYDLCVALRSAHCWDGIIEDVDATAAKKKRSAKEIKAEAQDGGDDKEEVSEDENAKDANQYALFAINGTLHSSIKHHIRGLMSAREAWNTLKSTFLNDSVRSWLNA
jgi:hypothetical protein